MRKFIVLFLLIFTLSGVASAQQMSDEQVIQYVQEASKSGKTQAQMTAGLVTRGVSRQQVERIKKKYDESQGEESAVAESKKNRRRADPNISDAKNVDLEVISSKMDSPVESQKNTQQVFGRNIFTGRNLSFEPNSNMPIPQNYRLGPGDEVIIDIWGASQTSIRQTISPEGSIILDNIGPVYLNGKTVKDANNYLQGELSKIYSGISGADPTSQIKLSVGQIRTIQINIMGEVSVPGTYTLSSFASVFHALYKAGGVNDIGSLRSIKVMRDGKQFADLDVYEYILQGKMKDDVRLMDNDVIVVSPYDCLVSIMGKVKRPMFYEMKKNETIAKLINNAGDFTGDAYSKNIRLVRKSGREYQLYNVDEMEYSVFTLLDGDALTVGAVLDRFENRVEIRGAVYREGMYQMNGNVSTVKQLIQKAEGLRGDAFLNRAVLERENEDLTHTTLSINLKGMINGTEVDIPLQKNDVLFIPSIHDLQEEGIITIAGEVARPGTIPFAKNTTLEDLVVKVGGLLESASMVRVDVSRRIKDPKATTLSSLTAKTFSFALKDGFVVEGDSEFLLEPFDEVYVRLSPGYQRQQNVFVNGEVLFEGIFTMDKKNQRLSEVIIKAGGVTQYAYLKGARLERQMTSEERVRLEVTLQLSTGSLGKDSISLGSLDLGNVYYVGIQLDKALATPYGDDDIVLREGDRIVIPQYNSTVKINGSVMYPNTVTYRKGEKLKYYINQAGGFGSRAEKKRAYIVYMNGTVTRIRKYTSSSAIEPGCEIIIPTKAERKGMSTAEIFSLGTSAASLATMAATLVSLFK